MTPNKIEAMNYLKELIAFCPDSTSDAFEPDKSKLHLLNLLTHLGYVKQLSGSTSVPLRIRITPEGYLQF
ncbi:MAG: hypothetical protein K0U41_06280 [Gammaproteobacteria bacterium]|nr:hypothetical protein [Gammaproteobacteria bacterium]